jgi:hypothetical protein
MDHRQGNRMRITGTVLPDSLYCWVFEHDDLFTHDDEPTVPHQWCQRCFAWLPPA